jgi:hypothetical protein
MKYLSFSLWGDKPIYNVGAIRNAELWKEIYSDWQMVVYYDNTVPQTTIELLKKNDVICVDQSDSKIYGPFWRFLASDLEDSEYVCFRDCDSRLSEREYLAVLEWIKSDKSLHVMRDHPAHKIPYGNNQLGILAGMWGLKSRKVPMKIMVENFQKNLDFKYGIDQTFLKIIYSIFENDKLVHDEFFEKKSFPIPRKNGRFIGERINIDEKPLTDDYKILL